jgi:hypothetical protein
MKWRNTGGFKVDAAKEPGIPADYRCQNTVLTNTAGTNNISTISINAMTGKTCCGVVSRELLVAEKQCALQLWTPP